MRAMVLAAGRGTRLGALTAARPKALMEVGGLPLLEHVLRRLEAAGCRTVVVNTHHHAAQVEEFLAARSRRVPGLAVCLSREEDLLDTGGALVAARRWLEAEGGPVLVHNADVLSDVPLGAMVAAHRRAAAEEGAGWTLAVQDGPTDRPLYFDAAGRLRPGPPGAPRRFLGIHVFTPAAFFAVAPEPGRAFPLADFWRARAAVGDVLRAFAADGWRWRDCGRPEDLRPLE